MAVKDFDHFMWTITQVIEKTVNEDLTAYRDGSQVLKNYPDPHFKFEDFKYLKFEYIEKKGAYAYTGYTLYGDILFRLDFETYQEDFDQDTHDYIVNYDYNSRLKDPWTEEELEEQMEKQIAK